MHTILLNQEDILIKDIPQDNHNKKITEPTPTKVQTISTPPPFLKQSSVKSSSKNFNKRLIKEKDGRIEKLNKKIVKEKQYSHHNHLLSKRNPKNNTLMTTSMKKMVSDINLEIEINAILNKVTRTQTNKIDSVVSNNSQSIPAHCHDIKVYKEKIIQAISEKFYDADNYRGKTCNFNIHLSPDGKLDYITAVSGDPELCQAAITSAKLSNLPKITHPKLYDVFKNTILTFSPE
ncbi:cell envelope integrity protein TolA [Candidatus Schneideria nysicola]|uniref:cell envelope integrity protein TolA n=1 Tax=Candidatus Schneideria nysicola TaxID=1081631 RepID=UPI001CAA796F|nr:cell envelope integrity protein TolA [Candidatus Schneideria nysicola]UAJ66142.1 cell envelope integrity protein TolA [Candidatus Schneideria nysicola]